MAIRISENTRTFYQKMLEWMDHGCPKTITLNPNKSIFDNAVSWDSQNMETAREVFYHLNYLADAPFLSVAKKAPAHVAVDVVLMLENGNYYKNSAVINFIKNRAFNGLSLK